MPSLEIWVTAFSLVFMAISAIVGFSFIITTGHRRVRETVRVTDWTKSVAPDKMVYVERKLTRQEYYGDLIVDFCLARDRRQLRREAREATLA